MGQPPPSQWQGIVEQYLQHLQTDVELPRRQGYSWPEVLGAMYAPRPEQRERVHAMHEAPYQRKIAEMKINEGRKGKAADIASRMEQARATAAYRSGAPGRAREEARFREGLKTEAALPELREDALKQLYAKISSDQKMILSTRKGMFGMDVMDENMSEETKAISAQAQGRIVKTRARRNFIAMMEPQDYAEFRMLSGEQQEDLIDRWTARQAAGPP
jgi:hypothetical protein